MVRLSIELDEQTRQISCQIPSDVVVTLGLLEYLREAVMIRMVRPALVPQVVSSPGILDVSMVSKQ